MAQITAERAGLYGHIKAGNTHQEKGINMPLTQKNRCQLFGSVNLAVANFNAEILMAIAASHNRRAIACVRLVGACASAFGASDGNWSGNFSHDILFCV